jgi:hypothetical protein
MTHSLVGFGLDAQDDADLRYYVVEQRDEPSDWAAAARWKPMHRFFTFEWDERLSEMERQFRQFYENGLLSWAMSAVAATREHAALYPDLPMPTHILPGAPGSVPFVEWLDGEYAKPIFTKWIAELYQREACGTTTGRDRLLLDEILREKRPEIEQLVHRYNSRKAWLARREAAEARATRDAERRGRASAPVAVSQAHRPSPRRYGELPPEPEITVRRRPG